MTRPQTTFEHSRQPAPASPAPKGPGGPVAHAVRGIRAMGARFLVQRNGAAAVEFALILPILIVLYLGSVELTNALTANRKMSQVASTVGDLVTQYRNLDAATLNDIFTASEAIMTPYTDSGLTISIAGIAVDADGVATTDWSRTNAGGTADALVNEVPASLKSPDSYLIVAKTEYSYQALFTKFSTDQFGKSVFELSDIFFLRPRVGTRVDFTP